VSSGLNKAALIDLEDGSGRIKGITLDLKLIASSGGYRVDSGRGGLWARYFAIQC
jgi:hypothetical protein